MENSELYNLAQKRLESKYGFRVHLVVYTLVCLMLIIINLSVSKDLLWAQWPIMGWGIGVFFHALRVYVFNGRGGVTDEMIQREMKKEKSE